MRIPDRLQFSVDVHSDVGTELLPPLALLTLVENAVHHGIDPCEQGGRIDVKAWRSAADGAVHLTVSDTGVGLIETAQPGTGLSNLRARLVAFYGGRARLELHENQPQGVRAELIIAHATQARA